MTRALRSRRHLGWRPLMFPSRQPQPYGKPFGFCPVHMKPALLFDFRPFRVFGFQIFPLHGFNLARDQR